MSDELLSACRLVQSEYGCDATNRKPITLYATNHHSCLVSFSSLHMNLFLNRFDYFGWNVDADIKVQYILDMFYELFGDAAASRSSTPSSGALRISTPSSTDVLDLRSTGDAVKEELTGTLKPSSRWPTVNRRGSNCQQISSKLHMDKEQILHFLLTVGFDLMRCHSREGNRKNNRDGDH